MHIVYGKIYFLHIFSSLVDDVVITSKDEARDMQNIIEQMCRKKLGFDLQTGDIVLGQFANLPNVGKANRRRRSSGNESDGHTIVSLTQWYF